MIAPVPRPRQACRADRRHRDRLTSLLAAAALAGSLSPSAAAGSELERLRPVLRYSAGEQHFAQPVSLPPWAPEVRAGDRVYGHVAREDGETWLQYWFFYAYDPQDLGILGTGRHEGDWELFQLRLDGDGEPDRATLAQHSWAEGCEWDELELTRVNGDRVPVLFVANGSHAAYSSPGVHDRPWPDPNDEADGEGESRRPTVTRVRAGSPGWLVYPDRWGSTEAGPAPGERSSPFGPRFQQHSAWRRPASFHEQLARPCGSGPPGRWWQTPVALTVLASGALLLWRRRLGR